MFLYWKHWKRIIKKAFLKTMSMTALRMATKNQNEWRCTCICTCIKWKDKRETEDAADNAAAQLDSSNLLSFVTIWLDWLLSFCDELLFKRSFLMMVVRLVTFKQWCWIIRIQKVKKSNRQNEKQIFQKYWGRLPWCIYFTFTYESGIRIDNGHIQIIKRGKHTN